MRDKLSRGSTGWVAGNKKGKCKLGQVFLGKENTGPPGEKRKKQKLGKLSFVWVEVWAARNRSGQEQRGGDKRGGGHGLGLVCKTGQDSGLVLHFLFIIARLDPTLNIVIYFLNFHNSYKTNKNI